MLEVYNSLTRKKEKFEPLHPPFVGVYVCGPTVYGDPHLGHAKSYISFDVIVRFLRALDYKVRYVQNITDVGHLQDDADDGEDKIQKRARLEKLEPVEIAQKYENNYFRDMGKLNCLRPDISCRATGHIPEMIHLVKILLDKGFAYESDGDIYFNLSKYPDYGKLSGRKIDELLEGTRIQTAEGKKHPADFALWKKADAQHLMQWQSPWGEGYPGWHLECSVMSMKYLGDSIDIHGGGLDNQFPHHECEIAQSEAANGQPFAKYWLHNNLVTVDGQKMSKSLDNFVVLDDLFDKYDPMTIRFFVLQGHYRSPQDFSDAALEGAQTGFRRLSGTVLALRRQISGLSRYSEPDKEFLSTRRNRFFEVMENDFNTSAALSILFDLAKRTNENLAGGEKSEELIAADRLFTELGETILGLRFGEGKEKKDGDSLEGKLIDYLLDLRRQFRDGKNWKVADEVRDALSEFGVSIEDGKDGTRWKKN